MRAKDVMSRHVVTVSALNSVSHAAEILIDNGVSGLPVLDDDGQLMGIVSEGDMLRRSEIGAGFANEGENGTDPADIARLFVKSHGWNVDAVMTRDVVTVTPDTPLCQIANLMMAHGFKRVPVLDDGRLVGIVSRADLLRCITRSKAPQPLDSDDGIALAVMARIFTDLRLDPDALEVRVRNGRVTLRGTVATQTASRAAEVAADCVPGVANVVNEIEVMQLPLHTGADV